MLKTGTVFNESEAQKVLATVNEKIARIFCTEPKQVRFVFVDHIAPQRRDKVCVGECNHMAKEIKIKVRPGWQNTAIHELAHLYSPGCSERKTIKIANDITRYLKSLDNYASSDYNDYRKE